MKNFAAFCLAFLVFAGPVLAQKYETFSYGEDERHKLDVYPQKADAAAPVVIFVHGGGWTVGRKSQYHYLGKTFQNKGIVFVAINYRLYPKAKFPAYPNDAAQAIGWVSQHVEKHGGDPKKLFLMGHSAGAHSVSLLGLVPGYLQNAGVDVELIRGVIAISSPMNLKPRQIKVVEKIVGDSDPDSFRPLSFIDEDVKTRPPFLLLHGKLDPLVPVDQSLEFEAKMQESGGRVKAVYYPKLDHISIIGAFAGKFEKIGKVVAPVMQFIEADGDVEKVESPFAE